MKEANEQNNQLQQALYNASVILSHLQQENQELKLRLHNSATNSFSSMHDNFMPPQPPDIFWFSFCYISFDRLPIFFIADFKALLDLIVH